MQNINTNIKRNGFKNAQRGYSIPELILGFSIAALAGFAMYAGFTKLNTDNKTNQLTDGLVEIVVGTKEKFGALGSYSAVTNANVINNMIVPKTFKVDTTTNTITHTGNGTVTLATADTGAAYTVTVTKVPKEACSFVVAKLSGVSVAVGVLDSMATPPDLTSAAATGTVKAVGATKPDDAKVMTQCAADTNADGVVEIIAKGN